MKEAAVVLVILLVSAMGCQQDEKTPDLIEFRLAEDEPAEGLTEMMVAGTDGQKFYIHEEIALSSKDIAEATVEKFAMGARISVVMTELGAEKLARLTRNNIGKRVAMLVRGKLTSAPVIRAEIREGRAIITGDFTYDEAAAIVIDLGSKPDSD
jgi:preprotein translocase subunit SecD